MFVQPLLLILTLSSILTVILASDQKFLYEASDIVAIGPNSTQMLSVQLNTAAN